MERRYILIAVPDLDVLRQLSPREQKTVLNLCVGWRKMWGGQCSRGRIPSRKNRRRRLTRQTSAAERLEDRRLLTASLTCDAAPSFSICGLQDARQRDTFELAINVTASPATPSENLEPFIVDWGDGDVETLLASDDIGLHSFDQIGSRAIVVRRADAEPAESATLNINVVAGSESIVHRSAQGLVAELFSNVAATADGLPSEVPTATRLDPTVNFDFGVGAPDPAIGSSNNYGIRWTGNLLAAETAGHTIHATTGANDSLRVWVNDVLVINSWETPTADTQSATQNLISGQQATLRVEYRAGVGASQLKLRLETPDGLNQILPIGQLSPSDATSQLAKLSGALQEVWHNVPGADVDQLTTQLSFIENVPGSGSLIGDLDIVNSAPQDQGERVRALITAPVAGYYTFSVAADTSAELRLSDGPSSRNSQLIASVETPTEVREFDNHSSQTSTPIYLSNGHPYYLELIHKSAQTSGISHASVAWTRPDVVPPVPEVIEAEFLEPIRPVVRLSADVSATNEASPFADNARLTVTRTDDFGRDLTVYYTLGGDAENGTDYVSLPQSVVIPKGESSATVEIVPIDDGVFEGAEQVVVRLVANDRYWLGTETQVQAVATIQGETPVGTDRLPDDAILTDNIDHTVGDATFTNEIVSSIDVPFSDLLQVDVNSFVNPWDVRVQWDLAPAVARNDAFGLTAYLRSNNADLSPAEVEIRFESQSDFQIGDSTQFVVGSEWTAIFVPFEAPIDFAAGDLRLDFRFGFAQQSVQVGGVELVALNRNTQRQILPPDALTLDEITFEFGDAVFQEIVVDEPTVPFNDGLRVEVITAVNPWDVRPVWDIRSDLKANVPVLVRGYIRSGNADGSDATAEMRIELNDAPYTGASHIVTATDSWQPFEFTLIPLIDYEAGDFHFDIRMGFGPQIIEVSGLELIASEFPIGDLPSTKHTYADRDAAATWRTDAEAGLEELHDQNLRIQIEDEFGNPVDDATVLIEFVKPDFEFGSTTHAAWFSETTGDLYDEQATQRYRAITQALFQRTVDSGSTQWVEWLDNPVGALETAEWSGDRGIPHKGHSVVWGNLSGFPAPTAEVGFDLATEYNDVLSNNGTEAAKIWLQQTLLDHVANNATNGLKGTTLDTFLPTIAEWDVINHPFYSDHIWQIVGESFMVDILEATRAVVHPATDLFINENEVLTGVLPARTDAYFSLIEGLLAADAPLDGIGFQSHFQSNSLPSIESIRTQLDRFAALDLELHVSEFDIDAQHIDVQTQADFTRDYLLATISNSSVTAFNFWGFWADHHWRDLQDAELVTSDFEVRPNGQTLLDFQNTLAQTFVATNSTIDFAGMAGEYRIVVRRNDGTEVAQQIRLNSPAELMRLVIPSSNQIGHWPFEIDSTEFDDEAAAGSVDDTVLVNGNVAHVANAGLDGAIEFFGDSGVATVAPSSELDQLASLQRTTRFWFHADDVDATDRKQVLFEHGDANAGMNAYVFDGKLYAGVWDDGATSAAWIDVPLTSQWHHFALSLNGASVDSPMTVYLDGLPVGQVPGVASPNQLAGLAIGNVDGGTRYHDGPTTTSSDAGFDGLIDELSIYDREWTAAEQNARVQQVLAESNILDTRIHQHYSGDFDIVVVGDGTVNFGDSLAPETGWGEVLGHYVADPVLNLAEPARSSESFYNDLWNVTDGVGVVDSLTTDDVVLIQFGIEDAKEGISEAVFKAQLAGFIGDTRAAGATPISGNDSCQLDLLAVGGMRTRRVFSRTHGDLWRMPITMLRLFAKSLRQPVRR